MRGKGNRPVDGRKGHREYVKNNSRARPELKSGTQGSVVPVDVLLSRQQVEQQHQANPNYEIDYHPGQKEIVRQVFLLQVRKRAFLSDCRRIEPTDPGFITDSVRGVEILHGKN